MHREESEIENVTSKAAVPRKKKEIHYQHLKMGLNGHTERPIWQNWNLDWGCVIFLERRCLLLDLISHVLEMLYHNVVE